MSNSVEHDGNDANIFFCRVADDPKPAELTPVSLSLPEDDQECTQQMFNQNSPPDRTLSQISSRSRVSKVQSFRLMHHRSSILNGSSNQIESSLLTDNGKGNDHPDSMPNYMSFTYLDALFLMFSICSFLLDIITDITVATLHYINGKYWYFALTVAFVALPTIVMTTISLRWYILDSREANSPKVSKMQWFFRVLFLMLQLGPVMRYIDSIVYGFKFRQNNSSDRRAARQYFHYMIYEDTDATMLRLFECFMEAAPQLVLQIYILAKSAPTHNSSEWTGNG